MATISGVRSRTIFFVENKGNKETEDSTPKRSAKRERGLCDTRCGRNFFTSENENNRLIEEITLEGILSIIYSELAKNLRQRW
jgi:hypothetical protein